MAEYLNLTVARATIRVAMLALLGIASSFVHAENLRDPTRPPASFGAPPAEGIAPRSPTPKLQSVLIGPGRAIAVISGQTVKVGDSVDGAKVVAIREGEVVLRTGKDLQTLKLFPGIEKRLLVNRAPAKADNLRQ